MLNWSDLCSLLTVLFGGIAGAAAAHDQKASWFVVALFAIGGLLLGRAFAFGASKLAYFALARSSSPAGERPGYTFLYLAVPILSLFAAATSVVLLSIEVLSFFQ
jgi:hypothetical protein